MFLVKLFSEKKDDVLLEIGPLEERSTAERIVDRVLSNLKSYTSTFKRPAKILIEEMQEKKEEN